MKRLILVTVIATQCLGLPLLACADPPVSRSTVTVRFGDLNLTQSEGVVALYARLRAAAGQACSLPDELPLQRARRFRACVTEALSAAIVRVDQPALSAYHLTKVSDRVPAIQAAIAR